MSRTTKHSRPKQAAAALEERSLETSTSRSAPVPEAPQIKWSQERRLRFIDFRLQWEGRLNRSDVTDFFKISVPQASADISRYVEMAPDNLQYDTSSRTYVATKKFTAQFETSGPRQYLSQLLTLENGILSSNQALVGFRPPCASVPLPSRPIDPTTLALLLRAVAEGGMLRVSYQAKTAECMEDDRYISPHAFGYDGARWHVRAYCHLRQKFRDFVFGRILSAGQPTASTIDSASDCEWHTQIEVVLVPDHRLTPIQRQGVEIDYGMKAGKLTIACRQAMLHYLLRTLRLEVYGTASRGEYQLAIENIADIKPMLVRITDD